jgi:hypothetical protein
MIAQVDNSTATLAVLYGVSLLAAESHARTTGIQDKRAARELAVIGRILERRLGMTRESLARALAAAGVAHAGTAVAPEAA